VSTEAPQHLSTAVANVFSPSGGLARTLDGYEARAGQRQMAEAVASVLDRGGTLLAEAGTGTGKTLAYLVPAILSRQRVLVSTGTKNLQEQIFFKDLPALERALGVRFTATLMKGRSNYLCLHRWELYRDGVEGNTSAGGRLIETGDRVLLPIIDAWAKQTETGDRAELRELPEDLSAWKDIAAEADTCLGPECPRYGECFVTRMRQRAAEADVVIVNHHLLCADAAVRQSAFGEVIPACSTLVVDEAHQLEDTATQYFGRAISTFRIDDLVRDAQRLLGAHPFRTNGPATRRRAQARYGEASPKLRSNATERRREAGHDARVEEVHRALTRVSERSRSFFAGLSAASVAEDTRARYTLESLADHIEAGMMLVGALEGLEATLALAQQQGGSDATSSPPDEATEAVAAIGRRAGELRSDLRFLLRAEDTDFVYYLETRGRGIFLRASPIDVSRIVQEALFDRMRAVVLTSATLAVDQSFDYVKQRLGIRSAEEVCVPSEFDYTKQTLLYLPRRMPPPKSPSFAEAAAREITEIVNRSRGRAFVLFTSYAVLRTVQHIVAMSLPYPLLVQGDAPRSMLLERFRSTPNAVLLATSSFWQGVDVAGEALSCVIIDKLPFASPADPIVAARIEAINAQGGEAFSDYQVPLAMLTLQQGLGRLIRHRADRGVLAILDPRLRTMRYGTRFLASLPPAPVTHDLGAVERFFHVNYRPGTG
jgi:ATP-dependent DNA helicase DinG